MEFFNTHSRYASSSSSSSQNNKKAKLPLNFYDVISTRQAPLHSIVFNTKNASKSIPIITELASNMITTASICILSSNGLDPDSTPDPITPDPYDHTRYLLPLTWCSKHGNAKFLPLDCVAKLPEYTQTTTRVGDSSGCILEFPYPPPISSSEERLFRRDDFINQCYQCTADLSYPKTVYLYRDYYFCCPNCRYRASVTQYWYKKVMNIADEDDEVEAAAAAAADKTVVPMEGGSIFFIDDL